MAHKFIASDIMLFLTQAVASFLNYYRLIDETWFQLSWTVKKSFGSCYSHRLQWERVMDQFNITDGHNCQMTYIYST